MVGLLWVDVWEFPSFVSRGSWMLKISRAKIEV